MIRRLRPHLLPALVALLTASPGFAEPPPDRVIVHAADPGHDVPHFWEAMFGSGRAVLSLRGQYREDLAAMKAATDLRYVRFHAILHDENGVYGEDAQGRAVYNFSYVDQIYDGLLAQGVRPVVEIGFMPQQLAERHAVHPFWYHPIVAPPRDYVRWDDLIRALGRHLVERYGIDEVAQWYFEVWNEPNIDFWAGEPKQGTYFKLYEHTARALKTVDTRLRVGGPATSSAHWVPEFIAHMAADKVPVDFISTHGYADDTVEDLFGTSEVIPMEQRLCRAVRKVHDQIAASPRPDLPLFWTEWNVPSYGDLNARDSAYMGAALADDIAQCDGLAQMMSLWTFSAVFEEGGPDTAPFHGQFGLIGPGGIRKPGFTAFALLHRLGQIRLAADGTQVLATRRSDGALAIAVWNLAPPDRPGMPRHVALRVDTVRPGQTVRVTLLDTWHGNTQTAYRTMGSPQYPTRAQIEALNHVAQVPAATPAQADAGGWITLDLAPNAVVLVEPVAARRPVPRPAGAVGTKQ